MAKGSAREAGGSFAFEAYGVSLYLVRAIRPRKIELVAVVCVGASESRGACPLIWVAKSCSS